MAELEWTDKLVRCVNDCHSSNLLIENRYYRVESESPSRQCVKLEGIDCFWLKQRFKVCGHEELKLEHFPSGATTVPNTTLEKLRILVAGQIETAEDALRSSKQKIKEQESNLALAYDQQKSIEREIDWLKTAAQELDLHIFAEQNRV